MARVDENAGEEERRVKAQLEDYIKKLEEEVCTLAVLVAGRSHRSKLISSAAARRA